MTIYFGPIEGATDNLSGRARLRLRARGFSGTGLRVRATLQLSAGGFARTYSAPAAPAQLVSGVTTLMVRGTGSVSYQQSLDGTAPLRLRAFGFGGFGGRMRLRLRAAGSVREVGTAYALLMPQDPVVSSVGGMWFENMGDTVALGDAAESSLTLVLRTLLAINDTTTAWLDAVASVADQLGVADTFHLVMFELISEGFTLEDGVTLSYLQVARVVSTLLLSGRVGTVADAITVIASSLAMSEALSDILLHQEGDTLAVDDAETLLATYLAMVSDALAVSDGLVYTYTGMVVVSDSFALDDTVATEAELIQLLHDSVALSLSLALDSGTYFAWALNTDSGAVTTYDNYPFNSFAKIGGRHYGATSTGVYALEGDTDDTAAINARLRLGMSEMGTRLKKSYSEVYVGYTGNGQMLLRVIFTDDASGQKQAAEYRMKPRPAAGRRESRFEPGKGLQAVYFDFELENIDGADFDLSSVDFQPLISNRRTRG